MTKQEFVHKWGHGKEVQHGRTINIDNTHAMLHDLTHLPKEIETKIETKMVKENYDDKYWIPKLIKEFGFAEFLVIVGVFVLIAGDPDLLDTIIDWMRSTFEKK